MAQSTISLPVLQLRSRQGDLEVTIRGSFLLGFPETLVGTDNLPAISAVEELEDLVEKQQAWINRVGPCLLRFSASASSQLARTGLSREEIKECVLSCPFWDQLGIRLVDREEDADDVVFSVQHPVLSSSLLPPKGALTVEMKELCVALKFSKADRVKSHRQNRATGHGITAQGQQRGPEVHPEDLQAIEDFLTQAGISTPEWSPASSSTSRITHDWREHCTLRAPESDFSTLMPSALHALLFGKQKRHVGVKWLDGENWGGLVQLAPAVFHVPYLEAVTQRARFMPAIAMSLARMVDAASPSLRRLATSFENIHLGTEEDVGNELQRETIDAVSGIEQSIWRTLLKHTAVPRVAVSGTKRRQHDPLTREESQLKTSTSLIFNCPRTMEIHVDNVLQAKSHVPVDISQTGDRVCDEQEGPTLKLTMESDYCLRSSEQTLSFHEGLSFTNQYQEDTASSILALDDPTPREPNQRHGVTYGEPLLKLEHDIWQTCNEVQAIDHGEEVWHDGAPTLIFGAAGQYN